MVGKTDLVSTSDKINDYIHRLFALIYNRADIDLKDISKIYEIISTIALNI